MASKRQSRLITNLFDLVIPLFRMARRVIFRLTRLLSRITQFLGIGGVRQLFTLGGRMPGSTLIVGPGLLPIPPDGWGAVETIIDEMSTELGTTRSTTVLNSSSLWLWFRAFRIQHEVIHVHYDQYFPRVARWRLFTNRSTPIVLWSHYPYLDRPELWYPKFQSLWNRIRSGLGSDDIFVALNPFIAEAAMSRLSARVLLLPNASAFNPRVVERPTFDILVLGRVDSRKRQYELSELALGEIDITCVGPIIDDRVHTLIAEEPQSERAKVFVGEWTRSRLAEEMSEFRVLLLPSQAEADALVLYEAQLAGLSIVCSTTAVGAQDLGLSWIYTHENDANVEQVKQLCERATKENAMYRSEIVAYARANFSWADRVRRLDECLSSIRD